MEIETIGVIGASRLGCEIAYAAAKSGYRTVLEDVSLHRLEDGTSWIRETLDKGVGNGSVTQNQRAAVLEKLVTARSVEEVCRLADLLITAASEELETQLELFTLFDKFAKPGAILAGGAEEISIGDLAAMTMSAENCVGLRFAPPVAAAGRLEIVQGPETSKATIQHCMAFGRRLGKEAVVLDDSSARRQKRRRGCCDERRRAN